MLVRDEIDSLHVFERKGLQREDRVTDPIFKKNKKKQAGSTKVCFFFYLNLWQLLRHACGKLYLWLLLLLCDY